MLPEPQEVKRVVLGSAQSTDRLPCIRYIFPCRRPRQSLSQCPRSLEEFHSFFISLGKLPAHLLEERFAYGDRWGSANGLPLTEMQEVAKGISWVGLLIQEGAW